MPKSTRQDLVLLLEELEKEGPIQPEWSNYSKLSKNEYHCHLSYSWVACWRNEKNSLLIEVYYAGSRENAPY
ncbi:hypothetical protein FH581_024510 (plasmid) [Leptospira weilii]|nr:hypothetical protein [Leptospira weilii]OMI15134.1 hypothetical protein BUQ74_20180 [Leptospira weilii serovar Heyan]ULH26840.1 hypothetical protein FH586_00330 [Leptospira weilii]ULH30843.1 hypothetical protein FH586_21730 [Leptospira weilii]UPY80971.1 hypothetical protein FH581_024510 [Leptospira weilii]